MIFCQWQPKYKLELLDSFVVLPLFRQLENLWVFNQCRCHFSVWAWSERTSRAAAWLPAIQCEALLILQKFVFVVFSSALEYAMTLEIMDKYEHAQILGPNLAQYSPHIRVRLNHEAQRWDWLQYVFDLALSEPIPKRTYQTKAHSCSHYSWPCGQQSYRSWRFLTVNSLKPWCCNSENPSMKFYLNQFDFIFYYCSIKYPFPFLES